MFLITEDPSPGSLLQCLAKRFYRSVDMDVVCVMAAYAVIVILAKYCTRLPDDGCSVIRNNGALLNIL